MKESLLNYFRTSWIYQKLDPKNVWRVAMSGPILFLLTIIHRIIGEKMIITRSKYNFLVKLRVMDYLVGGYMHLGETNPLETYVVRKLLHKGDIFFDVGAHLGWYTLNASQVVGRKGKVYAFEPNPSVASWLGENCQLNNLKNVSIIKAPVADSVAAVDFWVGESDALGSLSKANAIRGSTREAKKIKIISTTLDSFIKQRRIRKVKIIKIDVEGADLLVIKGGKNFLKRQAPYLIVEVFGLTWEKDRDRDKDIFSYLSRLGYKAYEFVPQGLRLIQKNSLSPQVINIFFAKDDRGLKQMKLLQA